MTCPTRRPAVESPSKAGSLFCGQHQHRHFAGQHHLGRDAQALRPLLSLLGADVVVAHVSDGVADDDGCAAALRAVHASGLVEFQVPEVRGYIDDDYADGVLTATQEVAADVVVLARQRSFMSDLFHRSVTARLVEQCPVPLLLLPTAAATA